MTVKRTGIWWSLCLAFGTAAFGASLGLGLLLAYFVAKDCSEHIPALKWAVGLLTLLGLLAASYGFAYVVARVLRVNLREALPLVGSVLATILVAGLLLLPGALRGLECQ